MTSSDRFTGKVAFVSGGASRVSRATAVAFATEGARVAIIDRTEDALRQTAEAIKGKLSPLLYLFGIAAAFVDTWIAGTMPLLVTLMWFIPAKRIERIVVPR